MTVISGALAQLREVSVRFKELLLLDQDHGALVGPEARYFIVFRFTFADNRVDGGLALFLKVDALLAQVLLFLAAISHQPVKIVRLVHLHVLLFETLHPHVLRPRNAS